MTKARGRDVGLSCDRPISLTANVRECVRFRLEERLALSKHDHEAHTHTQRNQQLDRWIRDHEEARSQHQPSVEVYDWQVPVLGVVEAEEESCVVWRE